MKSFRSTSFALGFGLLAAIASVPTPVTARTVVTFASPAACDEEPCGAVNSSSAIDDDPAVALILSATSEPQAPAPGSAISAAAMIALGVVMMTSRVRRKGLWAFRAPWRTLAAHPG